MPTRAEWFFKLLELVLKYWKVISTILIFLASYGGYNVYDTIQEKDQELLEKDKQLTNTVNYYTKKEIKIKNPCGKCEKEIAEMNLYIKRQKALEKKLDRALKEYHGE